MAISMAITDEFFFQEFIISFLLFNVGNSRIFFSFLLFNVNWSIFKLTHTYKISQLLNISQYSLINQILKFINPKQMLKQIHLNSKQIQNENTNMSIVTSDAKSLIKIYGGRVPLLVMWLVIVLLLLVIWLVIILLLLDLFLQIMLLTLMNNVLHFRW